MSIACKEVYHFVANTRLHDQFATESFNEPAYRGELRFILILDA